MGLDQLMTRVVERKGYLVQGADAEALFAKKGDDTLLVAWKTDSPLTTDDAKMFLTATEQLHATNGILVCPKGADETSKAILAATKGVEVWAESRLVIEVGEAFVRASLEAPTAALPLAAPPPAPAAQKGPTKFPSLISQGAAAASGSGNGIAYYMPNKKQEAPADMRATIPQQKGGSLGYAWGGAPGRVATGATSAGVAQTMPSKPRIKTDQWGNVIPNAPAAATLIDTGDVEIVSSPRRRAAAPAAPMPAPSPVVDAEHDEYEIITTKKPKAPAMKEAAAPACTTLKVNITREEAIARTGKPGAAALTLVPHIAFGYNVEMSRPGMPTPVTGSGALLISSLTGELRNVDDLAFNAAEPTDIARKDAEKMTAVDVYDKVKGFMAKTFTKTMNVEKEVAGNTVMSTLKLTPEPDEMGLEPKGMVYLPVWEVTISTGITKVDAFTGTVL